jgi:hypothetical protein
MSAHADDELAGTVIGAGAGGVIGNALGHGDAGATAAGVVVGGVIGNAVSRPTYAYGYGNGGGYGSGSSPYSYYGSYPYDMFPQYHEAPTYRENYVAPSAPPPPPPVTYVDAGSGSYCREFSEMVRIDGHMHETYGVACLQPDGTWHVVQ